MILEITVFQLAIAFSISSNLSLCILLLLKKENRVANKFLTLFIFSVSSPFITYLFDSSLWITDRWLVLIPLSFSYWIGPSLFFYVSILTKSKKLEPKDIFHFLPIVLSFSYFLIINLLNVGSTNFIRDIAIILENGAVFSVLFYSFLIKKIINEYNADLLQQVSNIEGIDLKWIKIFISALVFAFFTSFLIYLISRAYPSNELAEYLSVAKNVVVAFYILTLFLIGLGGFYQAEINSNPDLFQNDNSASIHIEDIILEALTSKVLESKLFLNPELSIEDLSRVTGISMRVISNSINTKLNKNFYQFINEYRVEEMKVKLTDTTLNHLTILGIALESGFNSKATANRVFKEYTGLTPKEYKMKIK